MSEAITWALLVLVILAVQASEGPPQPSGESPTAAERGGSTLASTFASPTTGAAIARICIAVVAGFTVLLGLAELSGVGGTTSSGADRNQQVVSGALQIAAGGLSLLLFYTGTERIPGLRRLRSGAPISWLAIYLILESLASNIGVVSGSGGGPAPSSPTVNPSPGPTARDLMLGEVPFLALAVASVGPVVRRNAVQTLERLGLWPLRIPWWVIGIAAGLVLVPVGSWVVDQLNHLATASCIASTAQAEQSIVGVGRTGLEQAGIAIAAGVCEELLFRGALQPRVGIVLSSVVWASYHLQYMCNGWPSPANLYLVLLGFAFGALRKWGGLWPAILAHAFYDGAILLHFLGA